MLYNILFGVMILALIYMSFGLLAELFEILFETFIWNSPKMLHRMMPLIIRFRDVLADAMVDAVETMEEGSYMVWSRIEELEGEKEKAN